MARRNEQNYLLISRMKIRLLLVMLQCVQFHRCAMDVPSNQTLSEDSIEYNKGRSDSGQEAVIPMEKINASQSWASDEHSYSVYKFPNGTYSPLVNTCQLYPVNSRYHLVVQEYLSGLTDTKLLQFNLRVANYTNNPLLDNSHVCYESNRWSRLLSADGSTINTLAFNFKVLSLMTLSFGVIDMDLELRDEPVGCLGGLSEHEKILAVLNIAMRDFSPGGSLSVIESKSAVCHKVITIHNGAAKFSNRCCYKKLDKDEIECYLDLPNRWLRLLDVLVTLFVTTFFIFGPLCVPSWIYAATVETGDYVVRLKESLYKTLCVCRRSNADGINAKHVLDLRKRKDFKLCRRILADLPSDMVLPIKISQFDIRVTYRKLLTEEHVPVGLIECIARALFLCKIRELEPFKDCCEANYLGCCSGDKERPRKWIDPCIIIGRLALVLVLPIPFYIRLIMYYQFEHPEVMNRLNAANQLEMDVHHNYRLMQHLTPTHPVYLTAYVTYLAAGMAFAYCTTMTSKTRFQQVIIDAFAELKSMSFLKVLSVVIKNHLIPFRKCGIFGCVFAIIIWPIFVPLSLIVFSFYCLPLVFLTCQIILYLFKGGHSFEKRRPFQDTLLKMDYDTLMKNVQREKFLENCYCSLNVRRIAMNVLITLMSLLVVYSAMLLSTEVVGFLLEILCFTLMGLIVNAGKVLKYGSLIFLVIIYSYDIFNVVYKKYLKLNKSLFADIRFRIKDIEEHTSLPSYLQEPRGFKACEASEQADYEITDDLSEEFPFHWDINDLILFIDKDDTPRIPRKLFDDTCNIRVAGTPGPVYRSLLAATANFTAIIMFLIFVFVVVMSFGEVYKISSTNQMLATLAGGFMPYIFRSLLRPGKPKVETDLLCFRSKLAEIIQNFRQPWPMYDFVFELEEKPDSDLESSDEDSDVNESSKTKKKKKKKKNKCNKDKETEFDKNQLKMDYLKPEPDTHSLPNTRRMSTVSALGSPSSRKSSFANISIFLQPAGSTEIIDSCPHLIRDKEIDMKHRAETMDLQPVEGNEVDFLILIADRDTGWEMEVSSVEDLQESSNDNKRDFKDTNPNEIGFSPEIPYYRRQDTTTQNAGASND